MNRIRLSDIPYQSLAITTGWSVEYNQFRDIKPNSGIKVIGLPEEDAWSLFTQDLLHLKHESYNIRIDLGWSPEASPEGFYLLTVLKDKDWRNPLYYYESKNKGDIVEKINYWLRRVTHDLVFTSLKAELN